MDQTRLDEIRGRCEAATPGPWDALGYLNEADSEFFDSAREDVSCMLAEIERLREEKAKIMQDLDQLKVAHDQTVSDIEAGRMLRLPAAIGQLVYVPSGDGGVYAARVKGIGVLRPKMHDAVMLATVWVGKGNEGLGYMIGHENKGTYWFETEADARAALEGGQHGTDQT